MVWNKEVAHERTPMSTRSRRVSLCILHMNLHVFLVLWADADRPRYGAGGGLVVQISFGLRYRSRRASRVTSRAPLLSQ